MSVMTQGPLETRAKVRDEKGRSTSPASHWVKQTDDEGHKFSQGSDSNLKIETKVKFHEDSNPVKIRHENLGIIPCRNLESEKGCVHVDRCHFRHLARISCGIEGVLRIGSCLSILLSAKIVFK